MHNCSYVWVKPCQRQCRLLHFKVKLSTLWWLKWYRANQRPRWIFKINRCLSSKRKDFKHLHHPNVGKYISKINERWRYIHSSVCALFDILCDILEHEASDDLELRNKDTDTFLKPWAIDYLIICLPTISKHRPKSKVYIQSPMKYKTVRSLGSSIIPAKVSGTGNKSSGHCISGIISSSRRIWPDDDL